MSQHGGGDPPRRCRAKGVVAETDRCRGAGLLGAVETPRRLSQNSVECYFEAILHPVFLHGRA